MKCERIYTSRKKTPNFSFKFVLFSKTPQTAQNKKFLHFGQIVNFVLNLQDREQI